MECNAEPWPVVVIGAGAAGLLAAIAASEAGAKVLLLEKNRHAGVKILMSGGTRCNLTHATDNRGIVEAFGKPGRFLHSSLAALSVDETISLFESEGVRTKIEETGKIFPVSNKARDVLDGLLRRMNRCGATLQLEQPVVGWRFGPEFIHLETPAGELRAERVILTTGGKSYPGSGTTGDGYRLAASVGHTIVTPTPALVPIRVDAPWIGGLRGITLPDVRVRVLESGRSLAHRSGSLLFAHFGLSGPVILDVSHVVSRHVQPRSLQLELDFLPNISPDQLNVLLREEASTAGKKQVLALFATMLPKRLVEALFQLAGVPAERKFAELSKVERQSLVERSKSCLIGCAGTLGFGKAEVTAGGIDLREVDSRSMRSMLCPRLYLAGEILDLDGPIGGYNFQAAFSTGWLAGQSAAASF